MRTASTLRRLFFCPSLTTSHPSFLFLTPNNLPHRAPRFLSTASLPEPLLNRLKKKFHLSFLSQNIHPLVATPQPLLETINRYHFTEHGKHFRPLIVILISQATSIAPPRSTKHTEDPTYYKSIDTPVSSSLASDPGWTVFSDSSEQGNDLYVPSVTHDGCALLPTQRRLAEITEMIHAASLLHDDVIDGSPIRRNRPSANATFGNKMSILSGDFLLARASIALARLRNVEVNELMATAIANLVEGEFMQLKSTKSENGELHKMASNFDDYMEKTYMKTASLIAKSCRAATVLGNSTEEVTDIAYEYGRNLGLAFQLVDDMLDFTVTEDEFGKPVGADLPLGLATAPVYFALEEFPELETMIKRKFSEEGDVEKGRDMVMRSNGLEKTKALAAMHCQKAVEAISLLPSSESQYALIRLTEKVLERVR